MYSACHMAKPPEPLFAIKAIAWLISLLLISYFTLFEKSFTARHLASFAPPAAVNILLRSDYRLYTGIYESELCCCLEYHQEDISSAIFYLALSLLFFSFPRPFAFTDYCHFETDEWWNSAWLPPEKPDRCKVEESGNHRTVLKANCHE